MMKRKFEPNSSKVKDEKAIKQKAPLKADLIIQLKELQENFSKLEAINSKNLETIRDLQAKVVALEKEKCDTLKQTQNGIISELVCRDCDYKAYKDSELSLHMENVHGGSHERSDEDLDSSQGFRVCNRCDYEAEDKYDLDGHIWTEHEEDEDGNIFCKFCDEKFANIPNMMMHKKIKHKEKIDYCQNFNAGGCPFEDRKCWFLHTRNNEIFKYNICEQTFSKKSQFMQHRKLHHAEMVKICKNDECIYKKDCWFRHEHEEMEINNKEKNENITERLVNLVEKLNKRVITLESMMNDTRMKTV